LMGHVFMSGEDVTNPPQQPGGGCMTDQLVGQFLAHVCGLGSLLDRSHIRTTLKSIMKYNFVEDLYRHVNPIRAFAMQDEKALVYGTYPKGGKPKRPCFRFFENWTGIEYAAAVLMLQEGRRSDALKVIKAIRDRFDGRKRNPFDEPECGHHYSRAMASWGAILALTGFHYSAVDGTLGLAASRTRVTWPWSTGSAWGLCRQRATRGGVAVEIEVLGGTLALRRLVLKGAGSADLGRVTKARAGRKLDILVKSEGGPAGERRSAPPKPRKAAGTRNRKR
jgi:non-lysosomal glucosylceramidase